MSSGDYVKISFRGRVMPDEDAHQQRMVNCCVTARTIEAFCLPIAEAWMCGTLRIALDNNLLRNHFNCGNGTLFESGSWESLTIAMIDIEQKVRGGGFRLFEYIGAGERPPIPELQL